MHVQPNSSQLRSYIPREEYVKLTREQQQLSLTGKNLDQIDKLLIQNRIRALELLEKQGFVYIGEKNWLLGYLEQANTRFQYYREWVVWNMETHLKLKFTQAEEIGSNGLPLWQTEFDASPYLLHFEALKNPAFLDIDELELLLGGDESGPDLNCLVKSFEYLHHLEYALSTLTYAPKGGRELSVIGIEISNISQPSDWGLIVISDYGSDWDFEMEDLNWKYFNQLQG